MSTTTTEQARSEYRRIRSTVLGKVTAARFDSMATQEVHELCDGEAIEPWMWVRAAVMVASEV